MAKRRLATKIAASSLILSMLVAAAGCNGKGGIPGLPGSKTAKEAKVIGEDTLWYDATLTPIKPDIDSGDKKLEYSYTSMIGILDGMPIFWTSGSYEMPDDFDWDKDDYSEYALSKLYSFDPDTEEMSELVDLSAENGSYSGVSSIQIVDDELVVELYSYDPNTWEEEMSKFTIDPVTGECSDKEPVAADNDEDEDVSRYLENTVKIGDTTVTFYYIYDYNSYESTYEVIATDASGKETTLDLIHDGGEIYGFSFVFPMDDKSAIAQAYSSGGDSYMVIDLDKGTVEDADEKEYAWLDDAGYFYDGIVGDDGKIYTVTNEGIFTIDFAAKELSQVLDFGNVGISRSYLQYMSLISYSEDKVVLGGSSYNYTAYDNNWSDEYSIITLTKADKNPNAGKTILELYCLGGYPENVVYDAISTYNNEDKDYFIQVTNKYDVDKYYDNANDLESEDDRSELSLEMMSGVSDELAVDLINGEGPDIILDAAALGQLNNDNYLADLSGYVKDLSSDDYFTNIIDASYTGDKLYQIPIAFTINGIQTASDNAGASGVGFTLDEYEDFVDDVCNGKDPIASGQNMYFLMLFNESSTDFIKDGKVDFGGEDFAALAEFCKDNAPEKSASWYSDEDPMVDYGYEQPTYGGMDVTTYSIGSYFDNMTYIEGRGDAILGYPSVDGQGPSASPIFSAAVSAQAVDVDACWDFIKTLLSEDIQTYISNSGYNVVNKAAYESVSEKAVEYYNDMYSDDYFYGVGVGAPSSPDQFSMDDVDTYTEIIESVTVMNTSDASISKIISEEMPAYFSGQKDLDEVIEIMQDRVQKVLDERG